MYVYVGVYANEFGCSGRPSALDSLELGLKMDGSVWRVFGNWTQDLCKNNKFS